MAPENLKGKIVGITAGTAGQFYLSLFLTSHQGSADIRPQDSRPEAGPLIPGPDRRTGGRHSQLGAVYQPIPGRPWGTRPASCPAGAFFEMTFTLLPERII